MILINYHYPQPAPGSVSTAQQLSDVDVQTKKISHLYKRQLSVPLIGERVEVTSSMNSVGSRLFTYIFNHR